VSITINPKAQIPEHGKRNMRDVKGYREMWQTEEVGGGGKLEKEREGVRLGVKVERDREGAQNW
jgi:hypothetical protein